MLTKTEFIMLFTKIIGGEAVLDADYNSVIDVLRMQRIVSWDYAQDNSLNQAQNLLNIICQNSIRFYETYLGE
ncbi:MULTISPECIES: hypothetical protein [unclassified Clostridium]|uniref:hypothetical protein n=1 Tax=unclassified Clostridium TaxID=2614128 RepID=UPI000297E62C|nr:MULTISPECIES: hypothetical protein [unclassified Clostridium]EKQ52740.1 MAG: hypothetical protein A370_04045 [Clostridium sp. Maddingley MBC34-26]